MDSNYSFVLTGVSGSERFPNPCSLLPDPTSLTLVVPDNCPQSITISNAGPQGSILNYTVADDGALGGFLDLNGEGRFVSGSLAAGATAQVTVTVQEQFATNWKGAIP